MGLSDKEQQPVTPKQARQAIQRQKDRLDIQRQGLSTNDASRATNSKSRVSDYKTTRFGLSRVVGMVLLASDSTKTACSTDSIPFDSMSWPPERYFNVPLYRGDLIQADTRSRPQIPDHRSLLCRLVHIIARKCPSVPIPPPTTATVPQCQITSLAFTKSGALFERRGAAPLRQSLLKLVAPVPRPRRPGRLFVDDRRIDHRPCSLGSANLPATVNVRLS